MSSKQNELPTTSDAEEWLDADTFIVEGKVYKVTVTGKIVKSEQTAISIKGKRGRIKKNTGSKIASDTGAVVRDKPSSVEKTA